MIRYRALAQLLQLPPSVDVLFFGGEGSYLLLHALHVALAEFDDAGYVLMMGDAVAANVDRVASYIESLELSSCSPALLHRPHILGSSILNDPIFATSNQSSLCSAAFASLDDGFLVTRAAAEAMLAERRRWLQVRAAGRCYALVLTPAAARTCAGCRQLLRGAGVVRRSPCGCAHVVCAAGVERRPTGMVRVRYAAHPLHPGPEMGGDRGRRAGECLIFAIIAIRSSNSSSTISSHLSVYKHCSALADFPLPPPNGGRSSHLQSAL